MESESDKEAMGFIGAALGDAVIIAREGMVAVEQAKMAAHKAEQRQAMCLVALNEMERKILDIQGW